jgi:hypothetical protein
LLARAGRPCLHLPMPKLAALHLPSQRLVWLGRFGLLGRLRMGRCSTSFP